MVGQGICAFVAVFYAIFGGSLGGMRGRVREGGGGDAWCALGLLLPLTAEAEILETFSCLPENAQ